MNIITLISIQALERSEKDSYVKNNWAVYIKEITMLHLSEGKRPSETIGDFFITPRGKVKHRIAWHFTMDNTTNTKTIYVDDVLYHITSKKYVDNWAEKARSRKINLKSYGPYVHFL